MSPLTESPAPDPTLQLLREMVRESERVFDIQIQSFGRADARSEQMIALSVLALGGGLAFADAFGPPGPQGARLPFVPLMGAALILNALALLTFLRAYLRLREHSGIRFGPSPEWIADQSQRKGPTEAQHLGAVLVALADDHFENLSLLHNAVTIRDRGVSRLTWAVVLYGAGWFYIAAITK